MKFSWKICFSTILISLLVFGMGGYMLISALFHSAYEREIANAGEENQMLRYSFRAYWSTAASDASLSRENVGGTAQAMGEGTARGRLRMRISGEDGQVFYDNTGSPMEENLLSRIDGGSQGYLLRYREEGYELSTVGMIQMPEGKGLYLESVRDVTGLFVDREAWYTIYRRWLFCLLALEGLFCYLMTFALLRPLRSLSRAAKRLAGGNLGVRARVETRDEIGDLAADFNHMADSLEQQFEELEDAARRQEDFIGSFAHELKTPLTSMIGYADMLRATQMSQEEQFAAANYIFKEGKRLEALSFKLLDLMVIKNGELEKRPVSMKWLAEDIQGLLSPALGKEGISLKVIMEDEKLLIELDLMKTVLLNLLDNGRKAMESGGTLYLLGRKEGEGFALYVRDTGKGMPKEELSRITEAFYMVDKSRSRQQGGAGLGLSICQEIVKRHGGTLEFKSAQGKGTIARVFLPNENKEETP